MPVHDLLGGLACDRVPAYASDGYFAVDPGGGLEAQLAAFRDQRFPGVKIKIGGGPERDAERAALARDAVGPDMLLMVDANGNYTADEALASMAAVAPYDIHFYEEPLPPTDFAGYRYLRARAPVPIAAGEALYTAWDFRRLIDDGGADVLQPDLTLCGGFDEAKAVWTMTRLANLRLSPHVWGGAVGLAAAVHFIAALPPSPHVDRIPFPVLLELDRGENALRDGLLREPLACIDGHVPVPRGPGPRHRARRGRGGALPRRRRRVGRRRIMARIMVVGASGFVGAHTARQRRRGRPRGLRRRAGARAVPDGGGRRGGCASSPAT